jgi:hypothetical protein
VWGNRISVSPTLDVENTTEFFGNLSCPHTTYWRLLMAIRALLLVWVSILWLATVAPASADYGFQIYNCRRNNTSCNLKCLPEIKITIDSGKRKYKLDMTKVGKCKEKCEEIYSKCLRDAEQSAPPVGRACTTNAQCGTDEICLDQRCVQY